MHRIKTLLNDERIEGFIHTTAASFALAICLQLVSVLVVRATGVEGRGQIAAAVLVPSIITVLIQFGLPASVAYWIATEPGRRRDWLGVAQALVLGLALAGILTSIAAITVLPLDEELKPISLGFTAYIPLQLGAMVHLSVYQADMNFRKLNLLRFAGVLGYLIVVSALFASGSGNISHYVYAQMIPPIVQLLFSIPDIAVAGRVGLVMDRNAAKQLLSYGARAFLGTSSPVETLRLDQLILGLFMTPYALGVYVIGMTFVTVNRLMGVSAGMVVFPLIARAKDTVSRARTIRIAVVGAAISAALAAGVEILIGRQLLVFLFAIEDALTYEVMTILVIGSVFMVARQVHSDALRGMGRPGIPALTEGVFLVGMLILSAFFWREGVRGVAVAVTVAAALSLSIQFAASKPASEARERLFPGMPFLRYFGRKNVKGITKG